MERLNGKPRARERSYALRLHHPELKPPLALFEPHILFAVLFKGRRQRPGHDAAVGQVEVERREMEGAPR